MGSRTERIMRMVLPSETPVRHHIFIPKYETTKGTSKEEQEEIIRAWRHHERHPENPPAHSGILENYPSSINFSSGSSDNYEPSASTSDDSLEEPVTKKRTKKKHRGKANKNKCLRQEKHLEKVLGANHSEDYVSLLRNDESEFRKNNSFAKEKHTKKVSEADSSGGYISLSQDNEPEFYTGNADSTVPDIRRTVSDTDNLPCKVNAQESLYICHSIKTETGKRIRNKRHACFFCQKLIIHLAKHFEIVHGKELSVGKLLAFPPKSQQRKEGFSELVRAGDFLYNCNVLSLKQGELILVRRPSENEIKNVSYVAYGPCPHCLGYMLKKHLWHHLKFSCKMKLKLQKEDNSCSRHVIAESNAMLSSIFGHEFSKDFNNFIISHLRDDEVGTYCKQDNLILRFGSMLYEKHGNTQKELIRQNMRQLARLTLQLKENTIQNLSLRDFLIPGQFDEIIKSTKLLCAVDMNDQTKRPQFAIPSLALKLGYALKKCTNIERGLALKAGNVSREKSLLSFLTLLDLEWCIRISSNALTTLKHRKLNVGQLLPVTSDLKVLNGYIDVEIEKGKRDLLLSTSRENWGRLARLTLTRIILFNKRRSGEASRITIEQYSNRPIWTNESTEEIQNSLTVYEKKLAEKFTVVNIIGKHGRKVPVILTPITKFCIDTLLKFRDKCMISETNPYIFACYSPSLAYLRGDDCLRKVVSELGTSLKQPTFITGTKLRKYVATVCQVFCLTENEHDWLARHLGHDLNVHRQFYRLHEDAVELTKISRLLLAVDMGQASKFKGKPLSDISLNDLPELEEDDDEILEDEDSDAQEPEENPVTRVGRNKETSKAIIKNSTLTKKTWSSEDRSKVFEYFKLHIKNNITPRQKECLACQEKHPILKNRKWSDIKFCVKNEVKKRAKALKNIQ